MEINNIYILNNQIHKNEPINGTKNNNCAQETVTIDTLSPLETLGRSQVNFGASRFKPPEYINTRDGIYNYTPPEEYKEFFNKLKANYNTQCKCWYNDYKGEDRFSFWASLCKYAPEKFEILYPLSDITLKSKEDFLDGSLLFDGYKTILRMDTEELKDSIKGIEQYNQDKLEELNDTLSENDLINFINENYTETLIKKGKIKIVTLPQKEFIFTRDKDARDCTDAYITCSNPFHSGEQKAQLHKYLNQFEYIIDQTWNRGERTPYMFDKIDISDNLEKDCRKLIKINKEKALSVYIDSNSQSYFTVNSANLYDYITGKEKLSLADAMMVMKYGDDNFQKEVIQSIKNAKVTDENFKSFGEGEFCYKWMKPGNGNTCVFQTATIKKGCHGTHRGRGGQMEFIMSDDPKEITFQNVEYDPEEDVFYVDSTVNTIK